MLRQTVSRRPAPVCRRSALFAVSSPVWGPVGVTWSLDDAAVLSLILQRRILPVALRGFLAQNTLQDVFALARRQVIEEILRRHLDEPGEGSASVEGTEERFTSNFNLIFTRYILFFFNPCFTFVFVC